MRLMLLPCACLLCAIGVQVADELGLKDLPGGAVGPIPAADFDRGFNFDDGLSALVSVEQLLVKYRDAADALAAQGKSLQALEALGFPDWESRVIGAANHGRCIEGTLLRQEYLLRRAELEILRLRNAGEKEIAAAEKARAKAADAVRKFWEGYFKVD